jgi:hypothetical protein
MSYIETSGGRAVLNGLGACCSGCAPGPTAVGAAYQPRPSGSTAPTTSTSTSTSPTTITTRPRTGIPAVSSGVTAAGAPGAPGAKGGIPLIVKLALLAGVGVGGFFIVKKIRASRAAK